ncbi:PIN domain-containing protein [Tautonia sociabilis]|uniref:PIN-like domain-containing protein n=1 Tax=Tautonia sociabilis TaxID=2080755 RepID=A0A432MCE8_9BACT|nr:PIN domain-containing protein [Tautonia sociabilis]RUL81819.1 hypothetical protein TsocGM_24495 [Tautonia sociabilis]
MRTNSVLVDFGNVQPRSFSRLQDDCFRLLVFVGASQARLPFEVAASVQRMGCRAEYVKVAGSGPNALDLHIAYCIGVLSTTDPEGYFHIISKDAGFDPLIRHLRGNRIRAGRVAAIEEIPLIRGTIISEWVSLTRERLTKMKAARPRSIEALRKTIAVSFNGSRSEGEIEAVIGGLKEQGYLAVEGEAVSYPVVVPG